MGDCDCVHKIQDLDVTDIPWLFKLYQALLDEVNIRDFPSSLLPRFFQNLQMQRHFGFRNGSHVSVTSVQPARASGTPNVHIRCFPVPRNIRERYTYILN